MGRRNEMNGLGIVIRKLRDFGLVRTASIAVNRLLWPQIQLSLLYQVTIDRLECIFTDTGVRIVNDTDPVAVCHHLAPDEIRAKRSYFTEKKLQEFKRRHAIGVKSFCLLDPGESEIFGFAQWIDAPRYFDTTFRVTIQNRPGRVYIPEISINRAYRQLNYGHFLGTSLYRFLYSEGYLGGMTLTRFENIPSLNVQTRVGGVVEKKYLFFATQSSGWVFPIFRENGSQPEQTDVFSGNRV